MLYIYKICLKIFPVLFIKEGFDIRIYAISKIYQDKLIIAIKHTDKLILIFCPIND